MGEMKRVFEAICDSYEIEIRMLDESIKRVRDFCNNSIEHGEYIIRAEDILRALDGEQ